MCGGLLDGHWVDTVADHRDGSSMNVPMPRLVKKPRLSLTTIGVFLGCDRVGGHRSSSVSSTVQVAVTLWSSVSSIAAEG